MRAIVSRSNPRRSVSGPLSSTANRRRPAGIVAGTAGTLIMGAAATLVAGRVMLDRRLSAEVRALYAAGLQADPAFVDEAKLAGLPTRCSAGCARPVP
jgi:hypothetical protein